MKYKNKCCQCGFCCLVENCPIAQFIFDMPRYGEVCPALSFHREGISGSTCRMLEVLDEAQFFGIGDGCCIKARAYIQGEEFTFCDMPTVMKFIAVNQKRKGGL